MTPAFKDINVYQGADYQCVFSIQSSDGTPKNLVGYTATLQVRSVPGSLTTILSYTSTTGTSLVINGSAGTVTLTIAGADTEALTTDQLDGVYDLRLVGGTGDSLYPFNGTFSVAASVTV